jgi:hypothetical protein
MRRLLISFVRRNSNGTNDPKLSLSLREIPIQRYFHGIANGKHQKKRIHSLVQDDGRIEGHEQLKAYITNYYKNLFGEPEDISFSLDETQTDDIPQVSMEENGFIT